MKCKTADSKIILHSHLPRYLLIVVVIIHQISGNVNIADFGTFDNTSRPGGGCRVVVSNKCCTREGVLKKIQRVQCVCTEGYVAGTTRAVPSCVPVSIVQSRQWCLMEPCLLGETCQEVTGGISGVTGWQCKRGAQIKTTKVTD